MVNYGTDAGQDGQTVVDSGHKDRHTVVDNMLMPANNNLEACVETLLKRTEAMEKKLDAIRGTDKIDKMLGVVERLEKFSGIERLEEKLVAIDKVVEKYGTIETLEKKLTAYDRLVEKYTAVERLEEKYGAIEKLEEKWVAYNRLVEKYTAVERIEEKLGAIGKLEEKLVPSDRLVEKYSAVQKQVEQCGTIMKLENSNSPERLEEQKGVVESQKERHHVDEKQEELGSSYRSSFHPIGRPAKFTMKRPIKFNPINKTAKFGAVKKPKRFYTTEKSVTFDGIKRLEMNVTNIDRELKRIQAAIYGPVNEEDDRISTRDNSMLAPRLQTDGTTGDTV